MIYKLTITLHSDKDHYPIVLQIGIKEPLAKLIMGQPLTTITARIEQAPGFISNIPLLDAKGEKPIDG